MQCVPQLREYLSVRKKKKVTAAIIELYSSIRITYLFYCWKQPAAYTVTFCNFKNV